MPCRGVGMESVGGQSESASVSLGTGLVLPERRESKRWGGKFKCYALPISNKGAIQCRKVPLCVCVQLIQVHLGVCVRGAVNVRFLLKSICTLYFETGSFIRERPEAY